VGQDNRIDREKKTINAMLHIYCHDLHGAGLCDDCQQLLEYAFQRLDVCPFQDKKPACNHCDVHCYSQARRVEIQRVMRYSGPRMLLRHPLLSVCHLLDTLKSVPKLKK